MIKDVSVVKALVVLLLVILVVIIIFGLTR